MRLTMTIAVAAVAMLPCSAFADSYQAAINGLMRASYRHLELTYDCRDVLGLSRYREARVAAENAVRATGMPTDVAMSAVAKMASRVEAGASRKARPGLNDCTAGVARTKRELLNWRVKFRRSQQ